jgi:hypothetical protein
MNRAPDPFPEYTRRRAVIRLAHLLADAAPDAAPGTKAAEKVIERVEACTSRRDWRPQ